MMETHGTDPIREAFENVVFLNFVSGAYGLRRNYDGTYKSEQLEDHWITFQEGWEQAMKYLKQNENNWRTDEQL